MQYLNKENTKLLFFSIATVLICYGFALTNYSLSVDNEFPPYPHSSLELGRWGTNLIWYHIFHGHYPYFTLLLSLLILGAAAVEIASLFKLTGSKAYIFCGLFLTFPQMAYQMIFIMQSTGIALGFLLSAVSVKLFVKSSDDFFKTSSILNLLAASFILMFVIAIYQGLVFIPAVLYLVYLLQNTFEDEYKLKTEFRKALFFAGMMIVAIILYFISTKILCPPAPEGGYLSSYLSGTDTSNRFRTFLSIWKNNLFGTAYYGNTTFIFGTIAAIIVFIKFAIARKLFLLRSFLLFLLLLFPFAFSLFITNGYHPPRIYLTSGIVYAFLIAYLIDSIKFEKQYAIVCTLICFANMFFVTRLYYSNYQIANHDKELAKKIDALIHDRYPEFNAASDYVYFYGGLPYDHHAKFVLKDSEAFGGSIFSWGGGGNFRMICLFSFYDIADYRYLDDKPKYLKSREDAVKMPVWPNKESIQKFDDVVIVKLNNQEGQPLF